jgi:hypothetical protein
MKEIRNGNITVTSHWVTVSAGSLVAMRSTGSATSNAADVVATFAFRLGTY